MRRILYIFMIFALFSCNMERKELEKPVIAVSILPQKYLISSIADTLADVLVMVPPGASPATWEATPVQMKSLGDARIYFRIGHIGYEMAWMGRIEEINPDLKIIDLSKNLKLRGMEIEHGDHSHHGIDPHTWMSVRNMEIMAGKVLDELLILFPGQEIQLQQNFTNLLEEIGRVRAFTENTLSDFEGEAFMIFHPSLGYFADDLGLEQYTIEYEGKEPSPAHLRKVIDLAKENGIKTIFVQQEFDKRNAEIIAEEINGQLIVINPLSESWPEEIKNISTSLKSSFLK